MKKLLVMLLAVSMVLSMAFTFAACGGKDDDKKDDSSVADSSVADSSVVESTDASAEDTTDASTEDSADASTEDSAVESTEDSADASTEDSVVESTDASTEDSVVESADEPSEDESEADSSEAASDITYKTTDEKTNYALGATYAITKNSAEATPDVVYLSYPATDWADEGLTKLTDGVSAAGTEFDGNGALAGVTVTYVGTNAMYEFIFDLGDYYGDINSIVFRGVRDGEPNGNNRGFNEALMMAYVGDSVGSWSSRIATTFTSTQIEGAPEIKHQNDETILNVENFDYTFTFNEAQKGRYVRVIAMSPVYCMQFDEIEIWN